MNIKDILAKLAKGETLTDAEKDFLGKFDLQKEIDAAASAARKKAEQERDKLKGDLAKLQQDFDAFKEENDPAKAQDATAKLLKRIEKLEKDKAESDAKALSMERTAKIGALAKAAGIVPAKGVDSKTIDVLVGNLLKDVKDLDDEDAVKALFDDFKANNAGLIAAETRGGAGQKGEPGKGGWTGANPFDPKTFNLTQQCELQNNNPELAASLAQQAGVTLT